MSGPKEPVRLIKDVLTRLSTIPKQIEELKKSSARSGAITALSRAAVYDADLNPEALVGGFLELNDDGTPFSREDYA